MNILNHVKRFWKYLKKDSWDSWIVSLILTFLIIKFIFFPAISIVTGSPLPLVVVESCSMYQNSDFDNWWERNGVWYEKRGIFKEDFKEFPFDSGLNKGDVIIVWGRSNYGLGDIIIFDADYRFPLIHRIIQEKPFGTKGDNNFGQLNEETKISEDQIIGKAVASIPGIGWLKLIFFEGSKDESQRGFCK
ncbi:hypothetical protein COU60_04235 [Candidatus Pacearchaeota archaeon CG10_big_fil_rev_8_21_14_0_10_34_76]|nr:MAG: hypothetical protein COU60_04235 [Candidatus Pacearchaeota archaeon CG10_big_fil_rev_8_21_14_0_10_34_76]